MNNKTLDEYMFSPEYSKDCAKLAQNAPRGIYGGFTKAGYTRYYLEDGSFISVAVSTNKKA